MRKNNMVLYKILLTTLISGLAITGIGFIDDAIWNLIFVVIGMIAYSIVGLLYSFRFLRTSRAGKDAYIIVFVLLSILGYGVYSGIVKLQEWVISWTLWTKILVPIVLVIAIIVTIALLVRMKKNDDKLNL